VNAKPSVETLGYCHQGQFEEPTVATAELRPDNYGKRRACGNAKRIRARWPGVREIVDT